MDLLILDVRMVCLALQGKVHMPTVSKPKSLMIPRRSVEMIIAIIMLLLGDARLLELVALACLGLQMLQHLFLGGWTLRVSQKD